ERAADAAPPGLGVDEDVVELAGRVEQVAPVARLERRVGVAEDAPAVLLGDEDDRALAAQLAREEAAGAPRAAVHAHEGGGVERVVLAHELGRELADARQIRRLGGANAHARLREPVYSETSMKILARAIAVASILLGLFLVTRTYRLEREYAATMPRGRDL